MLKKTLKLFLIINLAKMQTTSFAQNFKLVSDKDFTIKPCLFKEKGAKDIHSEECIYFSNQLVLIKPCRRPYCAVQGGRISGIADNPEFSCTANKPSKPRAEKSIDKWRAELIYSLTPDIIYRGGKIEPAGKKTIANKIIGKIPVYQVDDSHLDEFKFALSSAKNKSISTTGAVASSTNRDRATYFSIQSNGLVHETPLENSIKDCPTAPAKEKNN